MNNIDRYQEYIQDSIINHLERLMGNEEVDEVNLWEKYGSKGLTPPKDSVYKSMLHAMMVPYYEMYLNGDSRLCCAGNRLEFIGRKMESIIEDDDQFGNWASDKDLINAAENWGDNLKRFEKESRRIYRFFHVLEVLLKSNCQQDWKSLSEELKGMLFKAEVCYDYKTDEVLCVLHAFTMIMQQEWTKEKKKEMLDLLNQHWLFLKHYYSVMIRHIIGVKWTRFHKVAETVMTSSQSFKPHMHIFYCGLMDCVDELHLDRKQQREMDKVMLLMQEEINRVKEPSELLYPLCDAIFPEDFQRLLREHRPKSYKEIEDESHQKDELIKQIQKQNEQLKSDLDATKEVLEQMILSSIPIKDVDAELEQYPPTMAWELLLKLNESPILNAFEAWHNAYPALLKKYRGRLVDYMNQQKELNEAIKEGVNRPTYRYEAGSTHDDKRSQLVFGEEKEQVLPLKRLSNE
ncbi:hypothetical protein L6470_05920 [Prevotella communis]|uniref:hypothetical protein n=1 Tax=Prevotella communis TaxID=2913614 RepID=UPI001EDC8E1B|nr:hypothetical protein [Prevotella communis]UKK60537.1 hypothetical protein L6470_05920 [Prevotella communis]